MTNNLIRKYYKPIVTWTIIGILILGFLMMISDIRKVTNILSEINLKILPFILILAPLNYFFRYLKWNYYLKVIDVEVPPKVNRAIFISGLSMTITPAKAGELLKSYLLKEYNGTDISVTSPVIIAERITDAIAMIILASIGSLAYQHGQYILLFTMIAVVIGISSLYFDKLFELMTSLLSKVKYLNKISHLLIEFQQNAKKLFGFKSLMVAIGLGLISWGFEGFVVYLSLKALGGELSILGSIFVVSFSSILGALSVLPGGLGVAEGSIMGILILLGVSKDMSAATTLITRFSTLWLGVLIGVVGLFFVNEYIHNK